MGSWHGGRLAIYAAIKLPALLILTWCLVLPFGWTLSKAAGSQLSIADLALMSAHPILGAGVALIALVPVNLLFTASTPSPDPSRPATHNLLYVLHVVVVAASGLLATGSLHRVLREDLGTVGSRVDLGSLVHKGWLAIFAFVAGELGWALRPFVGNPYQPISFLRRDAFDGNVYEFIVTDIVPHFLNSF